jgi:hypothetical protein
VLLFWFRIRCLQEASFTEAQGYYRSLLEGAEQREQAAVQECETLRAAVRQLEASVQRLAQQMTPAGDGSVIGTPYTASPMPSTQLFMSPASLPSATGRDERCRGCCCCTWNLSGASQLSGLLPQILKNCTTHSAWMSAFCGYVCVSGMQTASHVTFASTSRFLVVQIPIELLGRWDCFRVDRPRLTGTCIA